MQLKYVSIPFSLALVSCRLATKPSFDSRLSQEEGVGPEGADFLPLLPLPGSWQYQRYCPLLSS